MRPSSHRRFDKSIPVEQFLWPHFAIHPDPELAVAGKGNPHKLDFEVFIPVIILDGNSQVCFHKTVMTGLVGKVSRARGCARSFS
jgi:hypothetical protein